MDVARRLTSLGRAASRGGGDQGASTALEGSGLPPFGREHAPRAGSLRRSSTSTIWNSGTNLADVLSFELIPNFRTVGPRLGEGVKELKPALKSSVLSVMAGRNAREAERTDDHCHFSVDGHVSSSAARTSSFGQEPGGYAVSRDGGEVIALDLTLTMTCVGAGIYDVNVIRQVQDLRKNSGFESVTGSFLHVTGIEDLSEGFDLLASECWP